MTENPSAQPDDPKELLRRLERAEREIASLRQLVHRGVDSLGSQIGDLSGRVDAESMRRPKTDPRRPFLIADITGNAADKHAWQEKYVTGAGLVDFGRTSGATGHTSAAIEIQGWENIPDTATVLMFEYSTAGERRYAFMLAPPPPPIQDGSVEYVLMYTTNQKMEWVEVTDCAEEGA